MPKIASGKIWIELSLMMGDDRERKPIFLNNRIITLILDSCSAHNRRMPFIKGKAEEKWCLKSIFSPLDFKSTLSSYRI